MVVSKWPILSLLKPLKLSSDYTRLAVVQPGAFSSSPGLMVYSLQILLPPNTSSPMHPQILQIIVISFNIQEPSKNSDKSSRVKCSWKWTIRLQLVAGEFTSGTLDLARNSVGLSCSWRVQSSLVLFTKYSQFYFYEYGKSALARSLGMSITCEPKKNGSVLRRSYSHKCMPFCLTLYSR